MAISRDQKDTDRAELFAQMMEQLAAGNAEGAGEHMRQYVDELQQSVTDAVALARDDADRAVIAQRGQRVLTSEERTYYNSLIETLSRRDYKQAATNLDIQIPETVINSVFEDLTQDYPIIDMVDARVYPGKIRIIMDASEQNKAQWGKICEEIIEEIAINLKEVEAGAYKLSAFIFICKPMLQLGADWLDRYVRVHLRDALAYGFEDGIVSGTGIDQPIGMIRDLAGAIDPVNGYAAKAPVALASFSAADLGAIFETLATTETGKRRAVGTPVFLYNPADWYTKIFPAAHQLLAGGYRNVLPFSVNFVPCVSVPEGQAIIGLAKRYLLTVATPTEGQIEFSDHYKFLEDDRTYIIKLLGNGMPKDNNSFVLLDIENIAPFVPQVSVVGTVSTQEVAP